MPKLVYQEIMQRSEIFSSTVIRGVCRESFQKHFNIFTPENIYRSIISEDVVANSGNFGFTRLVDLSPQEVTFLTSSSFLERLLFSMMRWERKFLDEFIDFLTESTIAAHCSDRNFSYKMIEELHDPWAKRLFVGFARTSESLGPRMPVHSPHDLIQEIDSELPVSHPALKFTHDIFGCSPPMHNFDPAKLLTDSGKLQTLDILLKRLRAGNHRVLLFAQMTKMLNILEDYMNYRKYKYFRLDGSSTIQDRRDMVKDFQHRSDVFVFLLSTRAGGLGINLTAADTVIFYESDWNPTLDLQAMDRAHRLGQTKDVTVYRLICKETVEEKILLRASQKSTVQNLVMTGGSVGGDLLAPEDVVSLLLDDVQLEQKLKEIPIKVKDKEKRKQPTKGIRVNEDGDASLEDLTNSAAQGTTDFDLPMDPEGSKSSNKKRKAASRPRNSQKTSESGSMAIDYELDDNLLSTEPVGHKPKRPKRTKNVNEDSFTASASIFPE
ncbi:hypothetical protein PIB30_088904 [Stylosanthes scabra]|uniref:Chromatin-remodeling ATPase INO80 n=1 Tax=Stylosanthes scabra TaxID=79078 RepID=A0ABU6RUK2_9FABA|nr:hypothetical protein [Stylosanthes scabra]